MNPRAMIIVAACAACAATPMIDPFPTPKNRKPQGKWTPPPKFEKKTHSPSLERMLRKRRKVKL